MKESDVFSESFEIRDIKPFDRIFEFCLGIDPDIVRKPYEIALAELDRASFELNQIHLKKASAFFCLDNLEVKRYRDFLIVKRYADGTSYILRRERGHRVSFVHGNMVQTRCPVWLGYCLTNKNEFALNKEYSFLDPNIFHPDYLRKNGELVKSDRRDIYRVKIDENTYYVKASFYLLKQRTNVEFYDIFEFFPEICKLSSQEEAIRFLKLGERGIHVPKVVGYSSGQAVDYLVLEGIDGAFPTELDYLENKHHIMEQDKQIAEALSELGLTKAGFGDYDDKIIKNGDLYLIDIDECLDRNKTKRATEDMYIVHP